MFDFGIFGIFLLTAFSFLPNSDGSVVCSFCPREGAEFSTCNNGNALCPYRCVYYVYGEPRMQHWGCFDQGQWPAVDILDRWNTLAEGETINQNHYISSVFHTAYVCSNADYCNRKSGYQRSEGGNGTTNPSAGSVPKPMNQGFEFCLSLILTLFLIIRHSTHYF